MNKSYRHGQILKLIRAKRITTQEDLARQLHSLGVEATQVTLSRDIRELGLVKTAEGYRELSGAPAAGVQEMAAVARETLTDVRVAQHTLVLRTPAGHAAMLAVAIDREAWPEVVGTIAGDDTVLVIAPDARVAQQLRGKLLRFLQ